MHAKLIFLFVFYFIYFLLRKFSLSRYGSVLFRRVDVVIVRHELKIQYRRNIQHSLCRQTLTFRIRPTSQAQHILGGPTTEHLLLRWSVYHVPAPPLVHLYVCQYKQTKRMVNANVEQQRIHVMREMKKKLAKRSYEEVQKNVDYLLTMKRSFFFPLNDYVAGNVSSAGNMILFTFIHRPLIRVCFRSIRHRNEIRKNKT